MPEQPELNPAAAPEVKVKPKVVETEHRLDGSKAIHEGEKIRTAKTPKELAAYERAAELSRIPTWGQDLILNTLANGLDHRFVKPTERAAFIATAKRAINEPQATPHPIDTVVKPAAVSIDLSKLGQYVKYETTPDGGTLVTFTVQTDVGALQAAGEKGADGKIRGSVDLSKNGGSAELGYDDSTGAAKITLGAGKGEQSFTIALAHGVPGSDETSHVEGGYENKRSGTTVLARVGGKRGEDSSAGLVVGQKLGTGRVATVELKYEKGEVTGTIKYEGPIVNGTIMIEGDRVLRYMGNLNVPITGGTVLAGGVEGSVDLQNPGGTPDVTGNLGVTVDMGKGGMLAGGAFLRKGEGDNAGRPEVGGRIDYTVNF